MDEYFISKLDDFIKRNNFNDSVILQYFLNPAEQYDVASYMKFHHNDIDYILYGGYEFAERRLFILNPTINSIEIPSVFIKNSGFCTLTHKDYLGAVLGLSIERWCIGDIITNENGAVIFTTDKIHAFLLSIEKPLEYIGRDKVLVSDYIVPDGFGIDRKFIEITGVIASSRLDSIVSVLIKTSREKSKEIITSGNVQHNFKQELKTDKQIISGDIISVRGYGRFNIKDVSQKTKKDKIRLIALKNI